MQITYRIYDELKESPCFDCGDGTTQPYPSIGSKKYLVSCPMENCKKIENFIQNSGFEIKKE